MIERTLHFNLEFEHVSGKSNDGADALPRMAETSTDAPEELRIFYSTRSILRLKSRLAKVSSIKNCPFDLLMIVEDGNNNKEYKEVNEAVRKGTDLKNFPESHPTKEFSKIIPTKY